MTTAGAAAWRVVKTLGMWRATPTAEQRAERVRVAIDLITDLRGRGLLWCAVARELRKRNAPPAEADGAQVWLGDRISAAR